ncbi:MAG: hypothetical protein HFH49_03735 [Lachnospiraceae bacterium]|nr:hypothetical protein [Lachnospiraceae bacterium]
MSSYNIKDNLISFLIQENICVEGLQVPEVTIDAERIKTLMINEVSPQNPEDFFYSKSDNPNYMSTTIPLFQKAGVNVKNIMDILDLGIYITTAVKKPKSEYTISTEVIREHMPILEHEIELFPNLRVIMLMGDVARKSFNMILRKNKCKSITGSTYKIRQQEFIYKGMRVLPSYIMTGGNILIEKSKCEMISEDIRTMMDLIS